MTHPTAVLTPTLAVLVASDPKVASALGAGPVRLVSRGHGRVVHLAAPARRAVTPTGALRRGTGPVCGQRGRAWPAAGAAGRVLCVRCSRRLMALTGGTPTSLLRAASAHADEPTLREAFGACTNLPAIERATLLLTTAAAGRPELMKLAFLAASARGRLKAEQMHRTSQAAHDALLAGQARAAAAAAAWDAAQRLRIATRLSA